MNAVLMWATTIIALGGAVGVVWKLAKPLVKKTKKLLEALERFVRDWEGEAAHSGRDAVPGVMERLNRIDGELKHNSGSSMKDAIKRIEHKLTQIDARLDEGNKRFDEIEKRMK